MSSIATQKYTDFINTNVQEFRVKILPHLTKPLYQRAMYWLLHADPKKDKIPNCRDFIEFVCKHSAAVQRIHMGISGEKMILIDGNNRLNALLLCLENPYKLFPDYFNELFDVIDTIFPKETESSKINNKILKDFFENIKYKKLRNWSDARAGYPKHILETIIKQISSEKGWNLNEAVIDIKTKWGKSTKCHGEAINLETEVMLSFARYHNYTTDEQLETFEDTNRFDSTMSKRDALAAQLCFVKVTIEEKFEEELISHAKKYLKEKHNDNEIYIEREEKVVSSLSAFDYLVSLNDYCAEKFEVFDKYIIFCDKELKKKHTMPIVFDLFEFYYYSEYKKNRVWDKIFTKENISEFNKLFVESCNILSITLSEMYPDNIVEEIFGEKNYNFGKKFVKSDLLILIAYIIKEMKADEDEEEIKKALKKSLFYHSFNAQHNKNCNNEEVKTHFGMFDVIGKKACAGLSNTKLARASDKSLINKSKEITKDIFKQLLDNINRQNINPYESKKRPGNRKKKPYYYKVMMTTLFKGKMPFAYVQKNDYQVDHMIVHSLKWVKGKLDLCRLGNLVPILKEMNGKRGNKDFDIYYSTEFEDFTRHLKPLIYSISGYNEIVDTKKSGSNWVAHLKNNEQDTINKYNRKCDTNEQFYINTFLEDLYS